MEIDASESNINSWQNYTCKRTICAGKGTAGNGGDLRNSIGILYRSVAPTMSHLSDILYYVVH